VWILTRANNKFTEVSERIRIEYADGERERESGRGGRSIFSRCARREQENSSPAIYPEVAANTVTRSQLSVAAVRSRIVGSRASSRVHARAMGMGTAREDDIGEERRDVCSVVRCDATPRIAISIPNDGARAAGGAGRRQTTGVVLARDNRDKWPVSRRSLKRGHSYELSRYGRSSEIDFQSRLAMGGRTGESALPRCPLRSLSLPLPPF
jgi:hypothetical protein